MNLRFANCESVICLQRYVFLTTFTIVDVIFPATFICFYAFFLTRFTIPLLLPPNSIYKFSAEILIGLLLEYTENLNGCPIRTIHLLGLRHLLSWSFRLFCLGFYLRGRGGSRCCRRGSTVRTSCGTIRSRTPGYRTSHHHEARGRNPMMGL